MTHDRPHCTPPRAHWLWPLLALGMLLSACAKDLPRFVPPAERAVTVNEQPWVPGQFLTIAYHDIDDIEPDQTFVAIRSAQLVEQLTWLRQHGYQAVSIDQILAARSGRTPLPDRAVLLSFDDGFSSFYTRVLPILKAWNWPAVLAPVGTWMDTGPTQPVDFGGLPVARERFLNWEQVAEIAASGLVEIAAHTDRSHYGLVANPQGNTQPAAASFAWLPSLARHETEAEFRARMQVDVAAITDKIRRVTGRAPRAWVWPYGAASGITLSVTDDEGYVMAMTLEDGPSTVHDLMSTPRLLIANEPSTYQFSLNINDTEKRAQPMRLIHIDLDYVYDEDQAQMALNLDTLIQRVADFDVNAVFLQAFSDPDADGLVRSVYFPNRHLPMRADLFNRVAWQLHNRTGVQVYAWMPVLAFDLDPALPRVTRFNPQAPAAAAVDPGQYRRLSPFDPRVREVIGEIYEDLARHAAFDGLLFHDDALLNDFEDASPAALAAYQKAGLGDSIANVRANSMPEWSHFKSRWLTDFTLELAGKVRAIRGPQVKTARNIYALPVIEPESEQWFAQNLDDFLRAYDWVAPMAMPRMENVPIRKELAWLDNMVDIIASRPGALDKTVFELQARDWRREDRKDGGLIETRVIAGWMRRLQRRGANSFGYYPDDFVIDHPRLKDLRPAISLSWFPFGEKGEQP